MRIHPYHLVDLSPWPLLVSGTILFFGINFISWIKNLNYYYLITSLILICIIAILWWRDIIRESKAGYHTLQVQKGILIGFLLFLLSEVMLFLSFFWAFFHSSFSPSVELGAIWPPIGINAVNVWSLPLLGSTILVSSGFILTIAHHAFLKGDKNLTLVTLLLTILTGLSFVYLQFTEYTFSEFTISDSVFGSVFYLTTGLHAIHVIIGVLFLIVSFIRINLDSFTNEHHLGYSFAIYYYHLVDIIWLYVFLTYYWWGS